MDAMMIPTSPLGIIPTPMMENEDLSIVLSPSLAPRPHPMNLVAIARRMTTTTSPTIAKSVSDEMSTINPTLTKKKEIIRDVMASTLCSSSHSQAWSANIIPAKNAPMIAANPMNSARAAIDRHTMSARISLLKEYGTLPLAMVA